MDIVDGKVSAHGQSHEVLQSEMNEMIQSNGKTVSLQFKSHKITCKFRFRRLLGTISIYGPRTLILGVTTSQAILTFLVFRIYRTVACSLLEVPVKLDKGSSVIDRQGGLGFVKMYYGVDESALSPGTD
jgi:hypothetical protein